MDIKEFMKRDTQRHVLMAMKQCQSEKKEISPQPTHKRKSIKEWNKQNSTNIITSKMTFLIIISYDWIVQFMWSFTVNP